jgi:hypothetical protein
MPTLEQLFVWRDNRSIEQPEHKEAEIAPK